MLWSALLFLSLSSGGFNDSEMEHQRNRYCRVFGVMYEVSDHRKADFLVYEEDSESFADLIVYDQDNKLYANAMGHWHFVTNPDFARYKLYFTKDRDKAHFSVFFTEYESFAGCNE